MNREIKVTKCGEWEDCEYNDRISIGFSPCEILRFASIFEQRALDAESYTDQTGERDMREGFLSARRMWVLARARWREIQKHQITPTKPELIFEQICKKNNLHFKYTGDGQLWIGKKKKINPDFIQADGKKIIVEIFGDYWHSPLLNKNLRESGTLDYRKRFYKKYKWQPIFIWESDLKREDAEQFVLNLLEKETKII